MDILLRVLHVGVAAAWFGHKLLIPQDLSGALAAGLDEARALVPRLDRAERLGIFTGVGTLLTGLLLAWSVGFDTVAVTVYIGLGLVVLAVVIGATVARPASVRLRATIGDGDLEAAAVAGGSITRVLGVESLLWAAALVMMLL